MNDKYVSLKINKKLIYLIGVALVIWCLFYSVEMYNDHNSKQVRNNFKKYKKWTLREIELVKKIFSSKPNNSFSFSTLVEGFVIHDYLPIVNFVFPIVEERYVIKLSYCLDVDGSHEAVSFGKPIISCYDTVSVGQRKDGQYLFDEYSQMFFNKKEVEKLLDSLNDVEKEKNFIDSVFLPDSRKHIELHEAVDPEFGYSRRGLTKFLNPYKKVQ